MRALENGFTLPIVLIFLQIFSCLGLSNLMRVSMDIKSQVHQWQKQEYMQDANKILKFLEDQLITSSLTCNISNINRVEIAKKPLSWWKSNTCHGNFNKISYYYAMEWLGLDTCGIIASNNKQKLAANYYRITLIMLPEKVNSIRIRLQSTLAIAAPTMGSCFKQQHRVNLGRQMRHEF